MNKRLIRKIRFRINRSGVGFFAPLIALLRLFKKRRLNYIHQMRVIYRYAFWKPYEPEFLTMTIEELMDRVSPGLREEIEAEEKIRREEFLKSLKPRTQRPTDLRTLLILDSNQEFHIQWHADFTKKELLIFTRSCWPPALIDFLTALPAEDGRFADAGIATPLQLDEYFKIKICLEYEDKERWYLAHVFMFWGLLDITKEPLLADKAA